MILRLSKAGLGSWQQPRVAGGPLDSEVEGQMGLCKHNPLHPILVAAKGVVAHSLDTVHWAKSKQLLGAFRAAQGDGVASQSNPR